MSGTFIRTLNAFAHLVLTIVEQERCYCYPHFAGEETEALVQGHVASKWRTWDLNLSSPVPGHALLITTEATFLRDKKKMHIPCPRVYWGRRMSD